MHRRLADGWLGLARCLAVVALVFGLTVGSMGAWSSPTVFGVAANGREDDGDDYDDEDDDDDREHRAAIKGDKKGDKSGKGLGAEAKDDEGRGRKGNDRGKGREPERRDEERRGQKRQRGKDAEPVQVVVVEWSPAHRVTVGCFYEADLGRSVCIFAGVGLHDDAVGGIAVPAATICAPVVDGDFFNNVRPEDRSNDFPALSAPVGLAWPAPGSGVGEPAYQSTTGQNVVTLVLKAKVETAGTAAYWLSVADGVVPVSGPGLRCQAIMNDGALDPPAATGMIVVQTFLCDVSAGASPPEGDWHNACTSPAPGARFEITGLDGPVRGWRRVETADQQGVLRVGNLIPGRYQLDQIGANWCHAESDGVDDHGNLIVDAGARVSVWIFDCDPGDQAVAPDSPDL
jgi:hypothetical protein